MCLSKINDINVSKPLLFTFLPVRSFTILSEKSTLRNQFDPKGVRPLDSVAATLIKLFQERIFKEKHNHVKPLDIASEVAISKLGITIARWQFTVQANSIPRMTSCGEFTTTTSL